ncbi:hypothetical protein BN2476_1380030 [Paraburkholderia piptadeniae]|uniref:Uncharacterized protein n=1 Tax=Paraburkholderia piptadeniae TaxID=1701573 RepID=A0A1N7SWA6_9BURK|nr:hypothetical protein BN2476_1380030 [Paraburkholderia piptadeniae]
MVLLKGIGTIDVTNLDMDLTGHSYVGDRRDPLGSLLHHPSRHAAQQTVRPLTQDAERERLLGFQPLTSGLPDTSTVRNCRRLC